METGEQLYLELLKKVLTNVIYSDPPAPMNYWDRRTEYDEQRRLNGEDWPSVAHTMVGVKRLDNLQACLERVIEEGVPGDFIETGVWRGGVCIFVRAVLKAYQEKDRNVWVADSFQGIPETGSASHPSDRAMALHKSNDVLAVSMKTVQENFEIYGLLDDQVKFLPGWFRDTLPGAPVEELAVMRLDGDLYESTMGALVNLYPKLSVGGFVIIDDYAIPACREAVQAFRDQAGISDPFQVIDDSSVFWRRSG